MRSQARRVGSLLVVALVLLVTGTAAAASRTIGQMIDDAGIVARVTAKLTTDQLSNLTKIDVKAENGFVTLAGTVDSLERRARAAQIASSVDGVKGVMNNIQVTGTGTATPGPPVSSPPRASAVDATGNVASVDPATGTITLTDGRILKATEQTVVWQATSARDLKPGTQVLVRGAAPTGFQPGVTSPPAAPWRMGTVSRVDRAVSQIVLTDGTVVRVTSATTLQRGSQRVSLDQIEPGSEVVIRTPSIAAAASLEASEVDIVWTPTASTR